MFVQCRGCNQTVPGSSAHCQFCGTSLAGVAPAVGKASIWHDDHNPPAHAYGRPKWVPLAYNLVASYIGISGLINAITGAVALSKGNTFAGVLGLIFGGIYVILGVGLLLKVELIRGIVNFVCGISLLFGVFGLFTSVPMLMLGGLGVLIMLHNVFDIITNAAMIYLVGETD